MTISIIAAMTENRVIGVNNKLPWRLSSDLKRFKQLTIGKPIIMGRKTFDSIGHALPGRENLVLTRDKHFSAQDVEVVRSVEDVLMLNNPRTELMIIGGDTIYRQFLPYADKLYLTLVHADIIGDAYFPEWSKDKWEETYSESHIADDKNDYPYTFIDYVKKEN